MNLIGRTRAIDFLQGFLKLTDVERKLKTEKLVFLKELVENFQAKIPYQNFRLLNFPIGQRRILTLPEIVEDGLSGRGGTCYALNRFLNELVKAVGFDARLAGCKVGVDLQVNNHHLFNLVQNCEGHGDLYMDVGTWYPSLDIIDLSKLKESTVFRNRFLEYKMSRENGDIVRYHRTNVISDFLESSQKEWRRFLVISDTDVEESKIFEIMNSNYFRPDYALLSILAYAVHPPQKSATLLGLKSREWDDVTQRLNEKEFQTAEEVYSFVSKYTPALNEELIYTAFKNLPEETKNMQKTDRK